MFFFLVRVLVNKALLSSSNKHLVSASRALDNGCIARAPGRGRAPADSLSLYDVPHNHTAKEGGVLNSFAF